MLAVAEVQAEEQEIKQFAVSAVRLFIIQEHMAVSGAQPAEALWLP